MKKKFTLTCRCGKGIKFAEVADYLCRYSMGTRRGKADLVFVLVDSGCHYSLSYSGGA